MNKRIFIRAEGPVHYRWLRSDPFWYAVVTTSEAGLGQGWSLVCTDKVSFAIVKHKKSGTLYGVKRYGHHPEDGLNSEGGVSFDNSHGEIFPIIEITITTEMFCI